MTDSGIKSTRLSVRDFSDGRSPSGEYGIIVMEGCEFPKAFTYNSPGMLNGVAFGICAKGTVRIKVNSRIHDIDPSVGIVILPNHIVEPVERSEDFSLRLIIVSLDRIAGIRMNIRTVGMLEDNPCIKMSAQDMAVCNSMFDAVKGLSERKGVKGGEPVMTAMLGAIVLNLEAMAMHGSHGADQAAPSRAEEVTRRFLKLVIAHYKDSRSTDFYADKLCISPKYLSQLVRRTTGETPPEWINKIVIIGAKNLISTREMSILQVSEEMNFPNPSFFGRFFKKHTGITPLEYKKGLSGSG